MLQLSRLFRPLSLFAVVMLALAMWFFAWPDSRTAYASDGCATGKSKRAHRTSGNGLPVDCILPVCHTDGAHLNYSASQPSGLPPPAPQTVEVTWNGVVQENDGATTTRCPVYIGYGAWH